MTPKWTGWSSPHLTILEWPDGTLHIEVKKAGRDLMLMPYERRELESFFKRGATA